MKRMLFYTMAAVFLFSHVQAQQIVGADFFDTDPGVRAGTSLSVTTGDSVLFTGNIPSGALPKGFHFLNIRVKNSTGSWSLSERRMFLVHSVAAAASLSAAEFYFDTDPGTGLGTPLAVSTGDSITFAGNIPSASLSDGFHFLCIRARDASGSWSVAERRMFFIRTVTPSSQVNRAEYFFDTDPGPGNGTSLAVTAGDSIVFSSGLIPSGVLSTGFHFLSIRTAGTDNKWSLSERRMFYIQEPLQAAPWLVAAEYFVNVDTGFGACADIPVFPGDWIDLFGALGITDTTQGNYTFFVRVKDSLNHWSLYESCPFIISNGTPVNSVGATDQTALFQNFPNPFYEVSTIAYYLHQPGDVTISIQDALGKTILLIRNENMSQGKHEVQVKNMNLSEGCYVFKLTSGNFTDTKRMMVIR